jgi:hypothetical protein
LIEIFRSLPGKYQQEMTTGYDLGVAMPVADDSSTLREMNPMARNRLLSKEEFRGRFSVVTRDNRRARADESGDWKSFSAPTLHQGRKRP